MRYKMLYALKTDVIYPKQFECDLKAQITELALELYCTNRFYVTVWDSTREQYLDFRKSI